jgi:hypothetical protein
VKTPAARCIVISFSAGAPLPHYDPGREEKEFNFSGGLDNQVLVE